MLCLGAPSPPEVTQAVGPTPRCSVLGGEAHPEVTHARRWRAHQGDMSWVMDEEHPKMP